MSGEMWQKVLQFFANEILQFIFRTVVIGEVVGAIVS